MDAIILHIVIGSVVSNGCVLAVPKANPIFVVAIGRVACNDVACHIVATAWIPDADTITPYAVVGSVVRNGVVAALVM